MKQSFKHRKSVRLYRKIIIIIAIIGLVYILWIIFDKYCIAKKLECYTRYGNCSQAILNNISWLSGTHLLKPLPLNEVYTKLKYFTEIKNINLYRRLPDTLVLSLDIRKPAGLIGSQVLGWHAISDAEGYIIGQTDKANYPLLLISKPVTTNDKLNFSQISSLKILGQMNSLSIGQVVGKIESGELVVYFPENFTVLLDLSHIASNWYTTLQVILTRSKILTKMPKVIDLRFSSPIVTF